VKSIKKKGEDMYFDLMYQTTMIDIMFCNDSEAKRVQPHVHNEGTQKKETKYWVGFGHYIDKNTEEKKKRACARVLNPKWILELTDTTKSNILELFFDKVKKKENVKYTLPTICKTAIVENANLILKRQVTVIEVKWDDRKKEMMYYTFSTKKNKKKEQLTKAWLYENFSTTLPGFYQELLSTKINTSKRFKVPAG
jgi:hypothetical protein